jgi:hypothetical protein
MRMSVWSVWISLLFLFCFLFPVLAHRDNVLVFGDAPPSDKSVLCRVVAGHVYFRADIISSRMSSTKSGCCVFVPEGSGIFSWPAVFRE